MAAQSRSDLWKAPSASRQLRHRQRVPVPPSVPQELRNRVFRGTAVIARGLLTRRQLDGRSWRRLFPDVYVHATVADTHALRARAAAGVLLPGAVVTGVSAAALWGVDLTDPATDVELTLPPGSNPRRIRGLRVRRAAIPTDQVRRRRGVLVTTPEATAVRLAGTLERDDAVVAVDRMLTAGIVDLAPIRALVATATGPGSRRARSAVALADERAGSPQESRLRLLMLRGGLPPPVSQFVVRDANGRHVARVDFAWPEHRLAVEYDGLWHGDSRQFAQDRARLNRLQAEGWRVVFVTAADLHDPVALVARIAAALAAVR